MSVRAKHTYCHTCNRPFHSLGIARHRAMHRSKKEDCCITMSDGTYIYKFSKLGTKDARDGQEPDDEQ